MYVHTHTHTPLRRWWLATFLIVMMMPMIGKGQSTSNSKNNDHYFAAHIWEENPSSVSEYKLVDAIPTPNLLDWNGTPFNFFTVSTCNKFSLRMLGDLTKINSPESGSNGSYKWQFLNANGTIFAEYIEPENLTQGEWEANYGNNLTYSSGITPDFQITQPGTYYLQLLFMIQDSTTWTPVEPANNNSIIVQVVPGVNNNTYSINVPDTVCFQDDICWSITPSVNPSQIVSYNWPYDESPCSYAEQIGLNTITVTIKKPCTDELINLTKTFLVTNIRDFSLVDHACTDQIINVGNITLCNPNYAATSYLWNWGDGTTSNTQYASHSYTNPGNYTVQLTLICSYNNTTFTTTLSKNITVYSYPEAPIVSGVFNTCSNPGTFTITNADEENATYTWNASYSSGMTGTSTSQNITWNTTTFPLAPNYGMITVIADNHGCKDTTETKIWNCCNNINNGVLVSNTTITSLPNLTNQEYFFNGTVIIDNNINLQNTNINFGPEAKIIVNPPYTFTTNYSVLKAGCNYMWDGIYTNSTQSKVEILNSPRVSDAYNVVNSTNGGNYTLRNSTFQDNYIVVKATDYRPSTNINHPGSTAANMFKNQTNMIAPYLGQKSYTGFYIDNVYNLRVGEVEPENVNTFLNLFCGIQAYNSYITVIHNKFQNIQRSPLCSPGEVSDFSQLYCETAIHVAKKQSALANPLHPKVTIGGINYLDGNAFTSCDIAYNSYLAYQTILNNTMSYCKTGISCRDIFDRGNVIRLNNFNSTASGIYLTSTSPSPRGITIENNTFNTVGTYGIRVFNCKSMGLVKTKVLNNTINYNAAVANGKGVNVANCDAITITGNTIASAALTSSGLRKFFRGVNIENSPNAIVKTNTFNNFGTGIYAEGMIVGAQFQCNTLYQNYYGFYMPNGLSVATVYSDQGTSAMPNDNQWTDHPSPTSGIPTYRITGDATPSIALKNWYYRAGITSYSPNILSPNPAYSFAYPIVASSNATSPCSSKGGDDDNTVYMDSTSTMENIIPENANLAVQMRYLYMSMLFNSNAEQFATEITQNEQSLYQNIPLIAKINDLSQNDTTIDRAIALNNTLAPVNEMETYRKFVNDIYLKYVTKGVQPSAELIDELYSIADMAPNIGGEAVYIARAILNYSPEPVHRNNIVIPHDIKVQDNIQFYPNPANDVLNISTVENFVSDSKIELYDITGRMVYSSAIVTESNSTSISLKYVNQGLYLCVIKSNKEIISSFKISVVKQ